jgi:hypothetical protein
VAVEEPSPFSLIKATRVLSALSVRTIPVNVVATLAAGMMGWQRISSLVFEVLVCVQIFTGLLAAFFSLGSAIDPSLSRPERLRCGRQSIDILAVTFAGAVITFFTSLCVTSRITGRW